MTTDIIQLHSIHGQATAFKIKITNDDDRRDAHVVASVTNIKDNAVSLEGHEEVHV
jgi:hypothetical protein